ncbi:integrase arm-type DNA-binding domain-containing protein [Methylovirgula sp. HY1]|uniref:integrase arm-type DNA-binding domain-containing protein n=1 Tax=Methylovirgula sp. HY1 TaxID=2822761 RepID=UPI001C5BF5D8|nr:integrase arm-type DNA-binding domain-containing protein [Methylovirgula sp. HY1]QXX76042.1 Tyrosine recombinase XerD [Methylovirgula sp. HY1]
MADIRLLLNDKAIARLPVPESGWYLARDTQLKGFFVVVGKRKKTFTVQGDLRRAGKRASTIRVSIGDATEMSTRTARGMARDYLLQISRGQHPKGASPAVDASKAEEQSSAVEGVTLQAAWERYRDAHMVRKGRSESTIESYRDHVERIFVDWLDMPLKQLTDDPAQVATKHDLLTRENGPYIANGSMRTLRAIYNHARKTNRELPPDNPVDAVDWNEEKRRNTAMGASDLKTWFTQLAAIDNPIRREFHLMTLLSGSRPSALMEVKPEHINLRLRILHIPKPKGGSKRAFDIPLSREMILCLMRALRFGRMMYPKEAAEWVFPAASAVGHLMEQKEDRRELSKWGNDLRQSYRTLAAMAGVSEFDARLLMNHAIPGVNAGYITRHKLLDDHLRSQQQAISRAIFAALGDALTKNGPIRSWLGRGYGRRTIIQATIDTLSRCAARSISDRTLTGKGNNRYQSDADSLSGSN